MSKPLEGTVFGRLSVASSKAVEDIVVQDSLRSLTADLISLQNSRRISAMRSPSLKAEGQHKGQIKINQGHFYAHSKDPGLRSERQNTMKGI